MIIMLYVTVVMPLQGKDADISKTKLVPVLTLAFVSLPIFLTLAIWPIWGFLSPIYMFFLCLGSIFGLTFLPDGHFGTVIFWLIIIGAATLSHKLPHAGHEHSW